MDLRKLTNELIGQNCMYPKWTSEDVREGNCKLNQCHTSIVTKASSHQDMIYIMRDIFCPDGSGDPCFLQYAVVKIDGIIFTLEKLRFAWEKWQAKKGYREGGNYYVAHLSHHAPKCMKQIDNHSFDELIPYINQFLGEWWAEKGI